MSRRVLAGLASLACGVILAMQGVAGETMRDRDRMPAVNDLIWMPQPWVTMYGKLDSTVVFEEVPKVGPGPHTLELRYRLRTVWKLTADGQTVELSLPCAILESTAEELRGRMVVVSGWVGVGNLEVHELTDASTPAEFQGKLERKAILVCKPKRGPGPHTMEAEPMIEVVWSVVTPTGTRRLRFIDQKLVDKAEALSGSMVTVAGLDQDGKVLVLRLSKLAPVVVRTQGKLQWVIRKWDTGELLFVTDTLPQWICKGWSISLGLTVDGKTRDLVFPSDESRRNAESLAGQTVEVFGVEQGQALAVKELKPVFTGSVQETVEVEIVGDLFAKVLMTGWAQDEVCGRPTPVWNYAVSADGKRYRLDFGSRTELATLAQTLDGRRVRIAGTLSGEVVSVTGLKEDGTTSVKKTIKVQITGLLRYVESDDLLHSVRRWETQAEGKTYRLEFGSIGLFLGADELRNQAVVLTGTLKDGVVTVDGLRPLSTSPIVEIPL
jgi:hypothetical protein